MISANETDNSTLVTAKMGTAPRRKPTIKDVARLAGVSTATVERALKDKDRIRGETRQRVLSAVQELGYQTNDVAKALQKNRIYNVLAVYHTVPEYFTGNFTRGFTAAAENLKSRGLVLTTIRTPSLAPSSALEVLQNVDFSGVDGMLIDCGGAALDDCIATVSAMGIPVATFGSDSPSSTRRFYVGEDPYVSGKLAGEIAGKMLGGQGELLAFKGPGTVDALNLRVEGMMDVIRDEYPGIEILPSIEHDDGDISSIRGAINILSRERKLSCVFCNSAGGTLALYRAIKYLDLAPSQVPAIIGYDFNSDISDMLHEGYCMVTLYQNPFQQAYNALNYLFDLLSRGVSPLEDRIIVPCTFVFKHNANFYLNEMEKR